MELGYLSENFQSRYYPTMDRNPSSIRRPLPKRAIAVVASGSLCLAAVIVAVIIFAKNCKVDHVSRPIDVSISKVAKKVTKKKMDALTPKVLDECSYLAPSYNFKEHESIYYNGTADSELFNRIVYQGAFQEENLNIAQESKKVILTISPISTSEGDQYKCSQDFESLSKLPCDFTKDISRFDEADAVIFHEEDLYSDFIKKNKKDNQVWIYNSLKPSQKKELIQVPINTFNLTGTYDYSSHLPILPMYLMHSDRDVTYNEAKKITSKDLTVAVFNENCIEEKKFYNKYIDIIEVLEENGNMTVLWYGGSNCTNKVIYQSDCVGLNSSQCYSNISNKTKFALAFEVSDMEYISERFFDPLYNDIVPIVIGNSREKYDSLAPPDSFIYLCNYDKITQLTSYLHELNSDNRQLNKYFKWREHWKLKPFRRWYCQVCNMLFRAANITTEVKDITTWM